MATIYGKQSSENILQDNRWRDISPVIHNLFPNEAPFVTFLAGIKKEKAIDPKIEWFSKEPRSDYDAVNNVAGYAAGATSIIVDNADKFLPGDQIRHVKLLDGSYNEIMRVTAVNTGTNTLTVTRGTGSTAAGALVDNDILLLVGDAEDEGSDVPGALSQKASPWYNYTQIFRTSAKYTRTLLETKLRMDDAEVKRRRTEKSREHRRKIEKAFLWGERGISGAGTDTPNRKTGGLYYWIQQSIAAGIDNTQNQAGGTLTEVQLEQFLEEKAFAYGSKQKLAICSPRVISVINNMQRGKIELTNMTNQYGIDITRWHSPHGSLDFVRHELFTQGLFKYAMAIVDPSEIAMKFIGNGELQFRTDIGLESLDSHTDDWLSEVGLKVNLPQTTALLTNVQTAA